MRKAGHRAHSMDHTPHFLRHPVGSIDGVVAVEPVGQLYRVFSRGTHGVTFHDYPFHPFLLLASAELAESVPVTCTLHRLSGSGALCWFAELANWHDFQLFRSHLQQSAPPDAWFGIPDSCQQFLICSGISFFGNLPANGPKLLFLCTQQSDHALLSIAVSDGAGFQEIISSREHEEPAMLARLTRLITTVDPDIIASYQLHKEELPCLISRAKRHGIPLRWGRNATEPHQLHNSDLRSAARYELHGRSLIDIATLVQHYDRHVLPLPGTNLQQAAAYFEMHRPPDNTTEPGLVPVQQVAGLYQRLSPIRHLQAQLYPISYQKLWYSPGVTAVQAVLIQAYLHKRQALPCLAAPPAPSLHYPLEQLFHQGQAEPVLRCDFSALPTAIVQAYRLAPRSDELACFIPLLDKTMRHSMALPPQERSPLIMAWYDLLRSQRYLFSDFETAGEIQRLTRVMMKDMLALLKDLGARPLLIAGHALYLAPHSDHPAGNNVIDALTEQVGNMLPDGAARLPFSHYHAMFCYKSQQYALLDSDKKTVIFRGSSFVSTSLELFLRDFLKEAVTLLLARQHDRVEQLYISYVKRLRDRQYPVTWILRKEMLADTREQYELAVQSGKRNRSAVYELACKTRGTWQVGETVEYYVTGKAKHCVVYENCKSASEFDHLHPDMNQAWYSERLYQIFRRFKSFLAEELALFP